MQTQLRALGQWEVVDRKLAAPVLAVPNNPTPEETRQIEDCELRAARAYVEIGLRLDDYYGETTATILMKHGTHWNEVMVLNSPAFKL